MHWMAIAVSIVTLLQVPAQTPKATIEGVVLNSVTGLPVNGARITATPQRQGNLPGGLRGAPPAPPGLQQQGSPAPSASSDDNGKFVLQNLDAASYTLQVQGNGFVQQTYGQRYANGPGTPIPLAAGQNVKNISLALTPAGNISGRIRDASGQAVVNVPVQLLKFAYNAEGRRTYQSIGAVKTNDRGEYRIYWVKPGRYYLRAGNTPSGTDPLIAMVSSMMGAANAAGNPPPVPEGYAFYPGVIDIDSARVIDVRAGDELQAVDFALASRLKTYSVRGRLVDSATGQAPITASVTAVWQTPGLENASDVALMTPEGIPNRNYNARTGMFEIGKLLPGSYVVSARITASDGFGTVSIGKANVTITDSDVEGVAISAFPGTMISGRLQVEGQLPQGLPQQRLRVRLIDASGGSQTSAVGADGAFRFNNVFPGDYRVALMQVAQLHITEARFDGLDVLNAPIHIDGSRSGVLDVIIKSGGGGVGGVVLDNRSQPVPGTRVVLVPDRGREFAELYRTASTDPNGRFTISGIVPGDYKVFSWEAIEEYSWLDVDLLRQFETRGRPVHITETSTETIEVTLIPAEATR